MSDAGLELQRAIYSALRADTTLAAMLAGDGIYDHVPPAASFPYITFGRSTAVDWSTSSDTGTEQLLSLHVWSQARGRTEVQAITARVSAVLEVFQPVLPGFHLVQFRRELVETRFDADSFLHHGTMRDRALVEHTGA